MDTPTHTTKPSRAEREYTHTHAHAHAHAHTHTHTHTHLGLIEAKQCLGIHRAQHIVRILLVDLGDDPFPARLRIRPGEWPVWRVGTDDLELWTRGRGYEECAREAEGMRECG